MVLARWSLRTSRMQFPSSGSFHTSRPTGFLMPPSTRSWPRCSYPPCKISWSLLDNKYYSLTILCRYLTYCVDVHKTNYCSSSHHVSSGTTYVRKLLPMHDDILSPSSLLPINIPSYLEDPGTLVGQSQSSTTLTKAPEKPSCMKTANLEKSASLGHVDRRRMNL